MIYNLVSDYVRLSRAMMSVTNEGGSWVLARLAKRLVLPKVHLELPKNFNNKHYNKGGTYVHNKGLWNNDTW